MKLCFPVEVNNGLSSIVYCHFGSAPAFVIIDTADGSVKEVTNNDQHHSHGSCNPLKSIDGEQVDFVIVGGIGAGALAKLRELGIRVFRAGGRTIWDNMQLLGKKELSEYGLQHSCSGHGGGGGCSHH